MGLFLLQVFLTALHFVLEFTTTYKYSPSTNQFFALSSDAIDVSTAVFESARDAHNNGLPYVILDSQTITIAPSHAHKYYADKGRWIDYRYQYSPSTQAMYPIDMMDAYSNLPTDLVSITESVYEQISTARNSGLQFIITDDGEDIDVAPSPAYNYDVKTKSFVLDKEKQAEIDKTLTEQAFTRAKAAKIDEINNRAQDYINLATGAAETPSFEVQTWAQQAAEAKAWHADSSAPTPMLSIIATQRGLPVDILRQKAYEKAVAYEQLVAVIAGKRQKYEQMLDAAKTVDDIEKIVVTYDI